MAIGLNVTPYMAAIFQWIPYLLYLLISLFSGLVVWKFLQYKIRLEIWDTRFGAIKINRDRGKLIQEGAVTKIKPFRFKNLDIEVPSDRSNIFLLGKREYIKLLRTSEDDYKIIKLEIETDIIKTRTREEAKAYLVEKKNIPFPAEKQIEKAQFTTKVKAEFKPVPMQVKGWAQLKAKEMMIKYDEKSMWEKYAPYGLIALSAAVFLLTVIFILRRVDMALEMGTAAAQQAAEKAVEQTPNLINRLTGGG